MLAEMNRFDSKKNQNTWIKNVAYLWSGQGLALLGTSISQFTLIWWLTESTGSAVWLALTSVALLAPDIVITPLIGPIIDRFPRKKILLATNLAIAVVSILGTFFLAFGKIMPGAIVLLILLRTLADLFRWPALQALATDIAPKSQLTRINAIDYILRGSTNIAGPVIAAAVVRYLPIYASLSFDIVASVLGILILRNVKVCEMISATFESQSLRRSGSEAIRSFKNGVRYVFTAPGLLLFLGYVSVTNLLLVPIDSLMPLLVSDYFAAGVESLSLIQISFGTGTVLGGVILGIWGGFQSQIKSALLGDFVYTIGVLIVGRCAPDQLSLAIFGWGIAGIGESLSVANLNALIQKHTRPELQGRVFSISTSIISALIPVTMLFVGPVAECLGVHFWVQFAGYAMLALMIGVMFIPAFYRYEKDEPVSERSLPLAEGAIEQGI